MPNLSRQQQLMYLSKANPQLSQRAQAELFGITRSQWRCCLALQKARNYSGSEMAFFGTREGTALLTRWVGAAHLLMTGQGAMGIRQVSELIRLSGLDSYVAQAYGSQQALNVTIENLILAYQNEQKQRLQQHDKPVREISLCEDETYHPQTCLVAVEPVSGYIVAECYAEDRSAETWNREVARGLEGLNVKVIQVTSDQASGLKRHTKDLGASSSPDLFHVQYDMGKAAYRLLKAAQTRAETALKSARANTVKAMEEQQAQEARPRSRGRPSRRFVRAVELAQAREVMATMNLEEAQKNYTDAVDCVAAVSEIYHPYRLTDGSPGTPEACQAELTACFDKLTKTVRSVKLTPRCLSLLEKVRAMIPILVVALSFFFATSKRKVAALKLPETVECLVHQNLIPAIYLDRVAARTGDAGERKRLLALSTALLTPLKHPDNPLQQLPPGKILEVEATAIECANLFQRSSSAVEGRNGQLSLHHHGQHRLSTRKLSMKTAVHNYHIRRADGTTAAERFFGAPPDELLPWILARLKPLSRSAQKRPKKPKPAYLSRLAA